MLTLMLLMNGIVTARAQDTNAPARLPEVTVKAGHPAEVTPSGLQEETRVGPNEQPEWTKQRRFPTTRVYLQKEPWEFGAEQWWRGRFNRNSPAGHLFQEEVEVGLPYRMQFDLYENWISDDHGRLRHHDVAPELRWAPAAWGKIPLNPTLYGEWKFVDATQGPDVYELKLLLGEELAPRWHWGFNVAYEQEVGALRTTEWSFSQGISYTLKDERLSAGLEMKFAHESQRGTRSNADIRFLLGPSVQWRPTARTHLDVVPLLGTTYDSPRVEAYVVFGVDFGPGASGRGHYAPTSLRGN